jgi:hypothetical protein
MTKYTTVQQLIDSLSKITDKTLPVIAIHSGTGVSHEVGNACEATVKTDYCDGGPMLDMTDGDPIVIINICY